MPVMDITVTSLSSFCLFCQKTPQKDQNLHFLGLFLSISLYCLSLSVPNKFTNLVPCYSFLKKILFSFPTPYFHFWVTQC